MRCRGLRAVCMVWAVVLTLLLAGQAHAAASGEEKIKMPLDCRYGQAYEDTDEETTGEAFPSDDIFRPLLADPKQPQFFATVQSIQSRLDKTSSNIASVAIGENFGFYTRRQGCNGWQVSLLTGIISQFNLDRSNAELINSDFIVGLPVSWRSGNWSTRLRWLHQSSHLGDEFLAANPNFHRLNLTYEEIEGIASYDYKWARMYAGAGYMVHREPATIARNRVQWGLELRGPSSRTTILGPILDKLVVTPVLSTDFKSVEEHSWLISTNVLAGLEWTKTGSLRRFRIMMNFYHGYNPYGQFFVQQKTEAFGLGAYFTF
jgi:Protein of unknown function (DUF1207)